MLVSGDLCKIENFMYIYNKLFYLFYLFRNEKKARKQGFYKGFIGSFITIYWEFYYYQKYIKLFLLGDKLLYFLYWEILFD